MFGFRLFLNLDVDGILLRRTVIRTSWFGRWESWLCSFESLITGPRFVSVLLLTLLHWGSVLDRASLIVKSIKYTLFLMTHWWSYSEPRLVANNLLWTWALFLWLWIWEFIYESRQFWAERSAVLWNSWHFCSSFGSFTLARCQEEFVFLCWSWFEEISISLLSVNKGLFQLPRFENFAYLGR